MTLRASHDTYELQLSLCDWLESTGMGNEWVEVLPEDSVGGFMGTREKVGVSGGSDGWVLIDSECV